ncbi:MAG: 4Fe-4S dicluster domain-containing protein, partial [candidate division WOR-3 bacterium]
KEILQNIQVPVHPASNEDYEEKEHIVKNAKKKLQRIFEVEDLGKKLDNFDGSYWETLHQKCLGCGICTYFCPTCHCFDINDEVIKSHGRRVRTWDSCMFPLFTLHASGHNPRPTKKERMRQRIIHKFNYSKKYYGKTFCVGCGRCIINCPVNVDVRRIVKEIMEA